MYVCAACVLRVYMRSAAVCDGRPDTYTCVRCNCRTRQTGYPSAPRHQHQPPGHRLQHQTGSLHAYRSDGNTILRLSVRVRLFALPPTTILTFAFLFSSILRPFLCLFFFLSLSLFSSLSIFRSLLLPLSPPCVKHENMHNHQTVLTAKVTHPSTQRCLLPMDSWKTDWDFLETIQRDLLAL